VDESNHPSRIPSLFTATSMPNFAQAKGQQLLSTTGEIIGYKNDFKVGFILTIIFLFLFFFLVFLTTHFFFLHWIYAYENFKI